MMAEGLGQRAWRKGHRARSIELKKVAGIGDFFIFMVFERLIV